MKKFLIVIIIAILLNVLGFITLIEKIERPNKNLKHEINIELETQDPEFEKQLNLLKKNIKRKCKINYKEDLKIIEIIPNDYYWVHIIDKTKNGDIDSRKIWKEFIITLKNVSLEIDDTKLVIALCKDKEDKNYILMVSNGQTIYNEIKGDE